MHKIIVNVQTGEVYQVEYTPEELAEHEAKVAAQATVEVRDEQPNQPS